MAHVLLVEDDPALAALYKDIFEKDGFSFSVATDGQSGLQQALDTKPDIILLDVILPKMNGMEVLTHIRATEWGKKEPIIILTNVDPDDAQLQNIIHTQPTYYLLKVNTTPDEVLKKAKDLIVEKNQKNIV
jgi:DNA-binding response OmpR family regulator